VTRNIPDYPANYTYERTAHVHLRGIPLIGGLLRRALDGALPGWEESLNWTMPLERRSLGLMILALLVSVMSMFVNVAMDWYARTRLGIHRITLRSRLKRFGKAFFSISQ
jgi:DNA-binding protein Fis